MNIIVYIVFMTVCLRPFLSAILVLSVTCLQAQSPADSIATRSAASQAILDYRLFIGGQAAIYNGTEYVNYAPFTGNAWFADQGIGDGTIVYDGIPYQHLQMLYDIIRDQVVISNPEGNLITLPGEKISEFFLAGHHFIHTPSGFYELLSLGDPAILAKRTKLIEESISGVDLRRTVTEKDQYFALKGAVYYHLDNLSSLLTLLKDKKKEINRYLRDNNFRYGRDKEKTLIAAALFYNNQNPHP
jgi:hypothetical protein